MIAIPDLAQFSATTVSGNTDVLDTQLFLFDENGIGVGANDDTDNVETKATIPQNSFSNGSGTYYLAISQWDDAPISVGDRIFPQKIVAGEILGPTGPGGTDSLTGWDPDGDPPYPIGVSSYKILLTGVEYSAVIPEPSSFTVWSLSILAVVGFLILRRQRGVSSACFAPATRGLKRR